MSESGAHAHESPATPSASEAREPRGRLSHFIDNLGDAFFAIDAQGRFTYVNERAGELLLRQRGHLLGKRIWDEFPEAVGTVMHRELTRALTDEITLEFEGFYTAAAAWFTVRACPTGDGLFVYFSAAEPDHEAKAAVPQRLHLPTPEPLPVREPYHDLAEAIAHVAWTAAPDGGVDYFNKRWFEYTGFTDEASFATVGWLAALHQADREPIGARWRAALASGAACECQLRLRRARDGAYRWHIARLAPVRDHEGRIVKWFATCSDVDDQRHGEEGLRFLARASEALTVSLDYEATLASIARLAVPILADWCVVDELEDDGAFRRMAIVHADPELAAVAWEMERRFPTDPGTALGPANVLRTGRGELYAELTPEMLIQMTESAGHLAMLRSLGIGSLVCVPLVARGRTMGAITFVAGASGRRYGAADLALLEDLAHRAALAVDNARLYEAEQQARRAAERSAGRTARLQAVTAALGEALTPAQVALVIVDQTMAALRAAGGLVSTLASGPDGDCAIALHSAGYPEDLLPELARVPLSSHSPLSDAIRTQEPIWLESEATLLARYPEMARMQARTGHVAFAALPLLVEGRVIGAIGLSFPELRAFHEEDRALALALARQCAQALERARLFDAEREARAAAEAAAEQVQRTQAMVVESERLRALGEMASGIAHDFNNILAVILGRCEVLINSGSAATEPATLARHMDVIRQAARDGEETVKRLQAFSGISRRPATGAMDIADIVRDVVEFTRPRWKDEAQQRGHTVHIEADAPPLPPLVGNPAELREVLVNMVFNALDAMPGGGNIRISVQRPHDEVLLRVSDSGSGMSEAVRRRVFEPFFTTKGTRGAGLGLSMSYGIVTRMGGHIDVESAPDEGTTFTIFLPYHEAEAEEETGPARVVGPLSILLVDDEQQVLETTQLMLELDGHQVTVAEGGGEALDLLRESGDPGEQGIYDVVLTDLGMPGMNGLQLLAALRTAGYTLPCLLVTGWGVELAGPDVDASGAQAVLPKPFSLPELRAALAQIMPDEDSAKSADASPPPA